MAKIPWSHTGLQFVLIGLCLLLMTSGFLDTMLKHPLPNDKYRLCAKSASLALLCVMFGRYAV